MMKEKITIKGNAPYLSDLLGFKSDRAFGNAIADAAKGLKETSLEERGDKLTQKLLLYTRIVKMSPSLRNSEHNPFISSYF